MNHETETKYYYMACYGMLWGMKINDMLRDINDMV